MSEQYKLILIDGKNEKELSQNEEIENLKIICGNKTKDNIIKVYKPCKFKDGCTIRLNGTGTEITLCQTRHVYSFNIHTCIGKGLKLYIGKNVSMRDNIEFMLSDDNASVFLGNDCMLSRNITFLASDGHAVIDKASSKAINKENKIHIGDRVWIDQGVVINSGVMLGNDSYIRAAAVVNHGTYPDNIELQGNPATVARQNIRWDRKKPSDYKEETKKGFSKKIISIIPARYQSSRFPGKPLALILGKPMIQWVYEKVSAINQISDVYIATDDMRIYDAVTAFGGKAIMTGACACGSERVYQAGKEIDCDIVLNIQGDEPMIKTEMIEDLLSAFNDPNVQMATLKKEITSKSDIENPNIAKLITDSSQNAIYFSRSTIPYNRDGRNDVKYYKHIGVYGYTKDFLEKFVELPQSPLEEAEQLEQLRAIENGYKIRVVETKYQSIGVDLPEHIALVEEEMKNENLT